MPSAERLPQQAETALILSAVNARPFWDELDVVLHTLITGRHFVTHGVCPTCLEHGAPETPDPPSFAG